MRDTARDIKARYLLVVLAFAGCAIIPIPLPMLPGPDPLKGRLDFVQPGLTTRAEVVANLSAPPIVRRNERFFGYLSYKRNGGVDVFLLLAVGYAVVEVGDLTTEWETASFVGIEFDADGRVLRLDRATGKSKAVGSQIPASKMHEPWRACLVTGLCLDLRRGGVVATAAEDEEAKRFQSDPERCPVYFVRAEDIPKQGTLLSQVTLDGRRDGETGPRTFLFWKLMPGRHEIRSETIGMGGKTLAGPAEWSGKSSSSTFSFVCAPGDPVFVVQDPTGQLSLAGPVAGRAETMKAVRLLSSF